MATGKTLRDLTPANDHGRCPICSKPGVANYRPFCSKRCADVDLARWLGGTYAIPGNGADDDEDGDGARDPGDGMGQGDGRKQSDADA